MDTHTAVCQVCTEATSKYKCPKCYLKYCSVDCCKKHKEQECQPVQQEPSVTLEIDSEGNISSQNVLFPTDDTVLPQTLEQLRHSRRLKAALRNPHLREMIMELDSTPNKALLMSRAMKEPIFTEFADICLSIVEPDEENPVETDSDEEL